MSEGSSYSAHIQRMKHVRRLIVLRVPTGGSGEAMGPSEKWVGLAAPLGEMGFDARWSQKNPQVIPTPRYAAVKYPPTKKGEKTASIRDSYGAVYDLTRQNSPKRNHITHLRLAPHSHRKSDRRQRPSDS